MIEIICGWEEREAIGYKVATLSLFRRSHRERLCFQPLCEDQLRAEGLYTRPHDTRDGQLWDVISEAPMATSFACSRFLAPFVAMTQWPISCDFADMMFLADPSELLDLADPKYAIMVVKHAYTPSELVKMDHQTQTAYSRKNWSSLILWNWQHPANSRLTLEMVNKLPGRDLHRFCWLEDDEIGELPPEWNYLVGVTPMTVKPKLLHFTLGIPTMEGYKTGPWADVWLDELAILDATRKRIPVAA